MSEQNYTTVPDTEPDTVTIQGIEWKEDTLTIYPDPMIDDGADLKGGYFITGEVVENTNSADAWDASNRDHLTTELGSECWWIGPTQADKEADTIEPYTVDEWDGGNRQD